MNLNDLLTGAWSPFTPLATQPAPSNNPQTLVSLLRPQVQIPWAGEDATEPILSTSATQDPYADFSDRAIDNEASPGSALSTPAVQDLYGLFSARAINSGSPPGTAPPTSAVAAASISDPVPGGVDVAELDAITSSPQDLYASFSDRVPDTGDRAEPAANASSAQDDYASFSDPVPRSGDGAEPDATVSPAQDLYASFSDQMPSSGDDARHTATTSSGEEPQLRLSDAVDQSNLAPTSSASGGIPAFLLNPQASTRAGLIQTAAYLGSAKQSWDGTIPPFVLAQNAADTPPDGGGGPPDSTEKPPLVGDQSGPSTGQKLVQNTLDLVPGRYYGRLASEQLHAGNYGKAAIYEGMALVDAALGVVTGGESSLAKNAARRGSGTIAEATEPVGGVYRLIDPETGEVMRTGRTNDLIRRDGEHGRHPVLKEFCFEPIFRTDDYAELRGLEQYLHELHNPSLNKRNPIDPRSKNKDQYMDAARKYLERFLGK